MAAFMVETSFIMTQSSEVVGSQGCSLGLEHLGLETVSRRFLERLVSSRS